ncbi:MAG: SDR family oxidoreductase [Pseudomonadota bacterium]
MTPSKATPGTDGLAVHVPARETSTLVTGAGSGIGRSVARALHARGERVILCGRRPEPLEETLARSDQVVHAVADVADGTALAAALAEGTAALGPVSTAVLSAALNRSGHFLDMPAEDFDSMTAANFTGVANTLRLVLPGMLENRYGRIVVIGTLADMNPIPGAVGYSATKGALHPLIRGVAGEIDRARCPDVLINEMTPGAVQGNMAGHGRLPDDVIPEIMQLIDLPKGGPSGGFFRAGKRIYPGESFKGAIKRHLRRLV